MPAEQAIGQVAPDRFVHRVYEEQSVRFCLVSFSDPANTDEIAGHAVEYRFNGASFLDINCRSEVFGPNSQQFAVASQMFKNWTSDYVLHGRLPL